MLTNSMRAFNFDLGETAGQIRDLTSVFAQNEIAPGTVLSVTRALWDLADRLARNAPEANAATKALLRGSFGATPLDQLADERTSFTACGGSANSAEGVRAFSGSARRISSCPAMALGGKNARLDCART
jgi:hypothetical protein